MPHILKSFDMDTQQGTWIFPWSDLTELPDSSEPLYVGHTPSLGSILTG